MTGRNRYNLHHKKLDSLIPYVNNSRTHSDEQVTQVASSIREFGFTNPILIDEQGGIIAGHGRVMAAKKLNLDEVPCIVLEGLTEAQKKAYVIADNKLALNANWDYEILRLEFESLNDMNFNVDLTGFDLDELSGGRVVGDDTIGVADDTVLDYLNSPVKTLKLSIPSDQYDEIYDAIESYRVSNGFGSISDAAIDMVMSI